MKKILYLCLVALAQTIRAVTLRCFEVTTIRACSAPPLFFPLSGFMMSGEDEDELVMRTIHEHQKRGRENEAFAMAFLFDSAEVGEIKRARNTGPRPGGSNASGCVSYRGSM